MKSTKELRKYKGVTLVVLVVTIVILLILAGITINMIFDDGILQNANNAKKSAEIAKDKEEISLAAVKVMGKNRGNLTVENLQIELNEARVFLEVDSIIVKMNDRYYEVKQNGDVEFLDVKEEKVLTVICKDFQGKELIKKDYTVLKNNYLIIPPEVDDYESLEENITGQIDGNKEIELTYYKIFDDDTELVFTGLNSSGVATDVESEIVSYMVGDGSLSTYGNALKKNSGKIIVKIPNIYKGKAITTIKARAFGKSDSIVKVILGENISKINGEAFSGCRFLEEVIFNGNVYNFSNNFEGCSNWRKTETESLNYKVINNLLYTADGKTLIRVPTGYIGDIIIDENVEIINPYALAYCEFLDKVVISDNVKKIFKYAIFNSSVKVITIGKSLTEMENLAIYNCFKLEEVTINGNFVNFTNNFSNSKNWKIIKTEIESFIVIDNILYSNDNKKLIKVPIGASGELSLPERIETILNYSVAYTGITKIKIPSNVSQIDTYAFWESKIKEVIIDSEIISNLLIKNSSAGYLVNSATVVYIKNNITKVGSYITDNFNVEISDKEGYIKYVKK